MTWWELSDVDPLFMRICECMARLLAHASRLKCADTNLKGLPASHKVCYQCALYALENIHHMVMQCPGFYELRVQMYAEIKTLSGGICQKLEKEPCRVFNWLHAATIEGVDISNLRALWKISGTFITKMYWSRLGRFQLNSTLSIGFPDLAMSRRWWCTMIICNVMLPKFLQLWHVYVPFYFCISFWDHLIQSDDIPFIYLTMVNKDTYIQCPFYMEDRKTMIDKMRSIGSNEVKSVLEDSQNFFHTIMGKQPADTSFQSMVDIWLVTGDCIITITLIGRT